MNNVKADAGADRRTTDERHRNAVENSLAHAEAAAGAGRFQDAVAWLEVVRVVDGPLGEGWERRRRTWEEAAARRPLAE